MTYGPTWHSPNELEGKSCFSLHLLMPFPLTHAMVLTTNSWKIPIHCPWGVSLLGAMTEHPVTAGPSTAPTWQLKALGSI